MTTRPTLCRSLARRAGWSYTLCVAGRRRGPRTEARPQYRLRRDADFVVGGAVGGGGSKDGRARRLVPTRPRRTFRLPYGKDVTRGAQ
jgi:hypothetical protein